MSPKETKLIKSVYTSYPIYKQESDDQDTEESPMSDGQSTVSMNEDVDVITGEESTDMNCANDGEEILISGNGHDTIYINDGDGGDTINTGDGGDTIITSDGNDTIEINDTGDSQNGNEDSSGSTSNQDRAFDFINISDSESVSYIDDWNYDPINWYTREDELAAQNALESQLIVFDIADI